MALKSLPVKERPRERLIRCGADALSTVELLAILLGNGTKSRSVLELAADLLSHFGSMRRLSEATVQELKEIRGIGDAKALQLQAVFAMIRRIEQPQSGDPLDVPERVYALIKEELSHKPVEMLLVLLCDARKKLIHREIISKGTLSQVLLHPREVFHTAIRHRAHSVIIAHNHPSGDATPSTCDIEMTHILASVGRMVGIELLDHLIVGREGYTSFKEKKLMPFHAAIRKYPETI